MSPEGAGIGEMTIGVLAAAPVGARLIAEPAEPGSRQAGFPEGAVRAGAGALAAIVPAVARRVEPRDPRP